MYWTGEIVLTNDEESRIAQNNNALQDIHRNYQLRHVRVVLGTNLSSGNTPCGHESNTLHQWRGRTVRLQLRTKSTSLGLLFKKLAISQDTKRIRRGFEKNKTHGIVCTHILELPILLGDLDICWGRIYHL